MMQSVIPYTLTIWRFSLRGWKNPPFIVDVPIEVPSGYLT